jgi:hypothetical protein
LLFEARVQERDTGAAWADPDWLDESFALNTATVRSAKK